MDEDKYVIIPDNCRTAMSPGSRLLIIEMIVPPGNTPFMAKLPDLEVLVMGRGKKRAQREYEDLCGSAGFKVERIIARGGDFYGIECVGG